MADFVAVIRRAVDGLSDNTPEMRAKVYEKARGAVVRQLESMKPRPPEEMLKRQLDKLEAAIAEVESEHALALPALEAAMMAEDEHALAAAAETQPAADLPEHEPEPEPAPAETQDAEPTGAAWHAQDDGAQADAAPQDGEDAGYAAEPEHDPATGMTPPEPPRHHYERGVWQDDDDYVSYVAPAEPADPYAAERATARAQWAPAPMDEPAAEEAAVVQEAADAAPSDLAPADHAHGDEAPVQESEAYEGPAYPYGEAPDSGAALAADDHASAPQAEASAGDLYADPHAAPAEAAPAPVAPAWDDVPDLTPAADASAPAAPVDLSVPPYPPAADPWDIPEDSALPDLGAPSPAAGPAVPVVTAAAAMAAGAASGSLASRRIEPAAPASPDWDQSPFDDVPLPANPALTAAPGRKGEERDLFQQDWGELDSFNDTAAPAAEPALERAEPGELERPKRVIRFEPKRRVDFTSLGLGLLGLAIVGGAAFGAWTYRETLSNLVSGVIGNPTPETAKPAATPTPTPAEGTSGTADPAPATAPATAPADNAATTPATPPADDNTVGDKFTQRLMKDGSEVDAGDGAAGSGEEGKSVAAQNVAAPDLPPPAAASGTAAPAAAGTAAVAGATQKMYVYEERIGQTVPTAIEGAVAWSLKNEAGADGKPEPVVEGQIAVPERGMTAKFTLRRNTDPSLPASHLIEIVFSLPADFEGGAIDSVQRVAMKQTEQDRGNSLVAVPAKITDDFHMIALNNFPDAMATNLDLLQSRNWIDIPVTYRNGRRALLTMEKGPTGTEAFNAAIREWKRLGGPPAAPAN